MIGMSLWARWKRIGLYVNYVIVVYRMEAKHGFEANDVSLHSKRDKNAV